MSNLSLEYTVHTEHSVAKRPIAGIDTTIFLVPDEVRAEGRIVVTRLGHVSLALAQKQAEDLGEILHHGEFVITTDPAVIRARAVMHDCEDCREGADKAIRMLRRQPDVEFVVGTLFWCEQP